MLQGDLTNSASVHRAADGMGTVFHLAAVVTDWGSEELFWQVTVEGSRAVFEAAATRRARVVLASSIAVYGDQLVSRPCTEDTPFGKPNGVYGCCKQAQEKLAWDSAQDQGLDVRVLRIANVYGPGSKLWVDGPVAALRAGLPCLCGGDDLSAGMLYVQNLVDALLLAASASPSTGQVFNVRDEEDVTWRQYYADLARYSGAPAPRALPVPLAVAGTAVFETLWRRLRLGGRPPLTREGLRIFSTRYPLPIDRIRAQLGFRSRVPYSEAMLGVEAYLKDRQKLKREH